MRTLVLIDGQNLFHLARSAWAPAALSATSGYSLAGRGSGGEWPFDDAMDVVAGGEAGGFVATRLVD